MKEVHPKIGPLPARGSAHRSAQGRHPSSGPHRVAELEAAIREAEEQSSWRRRPETAAEF